MIETVWRCESACFTSEKSLFCTSKQALFHCRNAVVGSYAKFFTLFLQFWNNVGKRL